MKKILNTKSHTKFIILLGVLYIFINTLFGTAFDTVTKYVNEINIEWYYYYGIGNGFGILIFILYLLTIKKFKTTLVLNNYYDYLIPVLRGIGFVPIPLIVFYSLERLDISIFTTILMTTPFFLYFWSIIIQKEKFKFSNIFLIFIGFCGVVIIVQPIFNTFTITIFVCFIVPLFNSLASIVVSKYSKAAPSEHLRFATCYWHTFTWPGLDPFGGQTFDRPWMQAGDEMKMAEMKLDAAFDFFTKIKTPFFCFHDRDISPEGSNYAETQKNFFHIIDLMEQKINDSGMKLLWGTANAFSHKRYMSGASTNPDPEVFAYKAAQVKDCMDATMRLGGQNYVLWGGREGYETILNTDMTKETANLQRFLELVVNYKHKIGFKGQILLEPKPHEPTKHQYDFDSATCLAFLRKAGLENEIKLNVEVNHATLSGHNFEHEIAYATSNSALGSIDINRGDTLIGWDTDQFPNNPADLIMSFYFIFKNGGLGQGGMNFDAKIRRQSIDAEDLFHAHIGGMDVCAKTLIAVEKLMNDNVIPKFIEDRYEDWNKNLGQFIHNKDTGLDDINKKVIDDNIEPEPRSGRQEYLENILNKYL